MRTTTSGRLALASLAVVPTAACGARPGITTDGTSSASCVAPYLDDQPPGGRYRAPAPTVSPGDTLRIYGHWYTSTCNDTGGHDPLRPIEPVRLIVTWPGGAIERLGGLTASGRDMGLTATLHVPAGTPSGTAQIHDDRRDPATYSFHVRR